MKIVVAAKERLYHFFSAYAPQTGCSDQAKEEFWSLLDEKTAEVPSKDVIIVAGDLNGHVGVTKDGQYKKDMGENLLEFCRKSTSYHTTAMDDWKYHKTYLDITCSSNGSTRTRIDFFLVKDLDRSLVTDAKVVPYETVAPQHRSLICTLKIAPPRLKQEATDAIRQAARSELGTTKPGRRKVDKQAWLWIDDLKAKVQEKKTLYHAFLGEKTADNWRKYQETKKAAKRAAAVAKATHYGDVNEKLESCDGVRQTEDIERFFGTNDEDGRLLMDRKKALMRWRDYFEEISTVEFSHPPIP
ncbi:unnamed protein product [Heligmosomoides polygyrus]|uniref:Endo/exonuclease/phosphatase domain-containing protein n=1 Tax=Heligmosomoides polygyrus TaxID=6339 RepID=A0A183F603_HELPZ|nr:unnamed protein product [Heligmosomoides polygyrus]